MRPNAGAAEKSRSARSRSHSAKPSGVRSFVAAPDKHFSVDQAPTRSVALISADGRSWAHRDLDGEAYGTPGLSPEGSHAVWVQADDLLTWEAGSFGTAPQPTGSAQVVTVDDHGTILAIAVGTSAGQCSVEIRTNEADFPQAVVPIARADELPCRELGLALTQPTEIRGDLSGQSGTEFVARNTSTGGWALTARPPIVAPGLDVYLDDPAIAIWNQLTINTQRDLVAVGSRTDSTSPPSITTARGNAGRSHGSCTLLVLLAVGAGSATPECCKAPYSGCV